MYQTLTFMCFFQNVCSSSFNCNTTRLPAYLSPFLNLPDLVHCCIWKLLSPLYMLCTLKVVQWSTQYLLFSSFFNDTVEWKLEVETILLEYYSLSSVWGKYTYLVPWYNLPYLSCNTHMGTKSWGGLIADTVYRLHRNMSNLRTLKRHGLAYCRINTVHIQSDLLIQKYFQEESKYSFSTHNLIL